MENVSEPRHSVEVIRNNHIICTYVYSSLGPILEYIDYLKGNPSGAVFKHNVAITIAARTLVFAQTTGVEINKVTWSALRALKEARVRVKTGAIVEESAESLEKAMERMRDPRQFFRILRMSTSLEAESGCSWSVLDVGYGWATAG